MQNKTGKTTYSEIKPFDGVRRPLKLSDFKDVDLETLDWKTSGLKVVGVSIMAFVLSFGLSSVGGTISYFNDVEQTIGNFLQADPLSFKVAIENESESSTSAQVDLSSGQNSVTPIMTPDSDSEPIQYFVKSIVTGGDSDLCNAISVLGTYPFPYSGSLATLYTATSTSVGAWTLEFSLPEVNLFSNKSCIVDLVYEGWNADVSYGKGYKDTQKISLTFFVPEISEDIAPEVSSFILTPTEEEVVPPPSETQPEEEGSEENAETPVDEVTPPEEETPPVENLTEPEEVVEPPVEETTPPPVEVPETPVETPTETPTEPTV